MKFVRKKLPLAEGHGLLRPCPVDAFEPYTLMFAPVYVPLQVNGKFVAVKGPLDFFSPAELERFKTHPQLFYHQSVDDLDLLRAATQRLKKLMIRGESSDDPEALGKAPHEISDELLRVLGKILGPRMILEPFFVAFIMDEVLLPIPGELLMKGRELSIENLELGIMRASIAVMLALFLGVFDREWLSELRSEIVEETLGLRNDPIGIDEFREIRNLADRWISSADCEEISFAVVDMSDGGRAGAKLERRLVRVMNEIAQLSVEPPSLKGPKGFLSV